MNDVVTIGDLRGDLFLRFAILLQNRNIAIRNDLDILCYHCFKLICFHSVWYVLWVRENEFDFDLWFKRGVRVDGEVHATVLLPQYLKFDCGIVNCISDFLRPSLTEDRETENAILLNLGYSKCSLVLFQVFVIFICWTGCLYTLAFHWIIDG